MKLLRRPRMIPVLASLGMTGIFGLILIAASQYSPVHKQVADLNAFDVPASFRPAAPVLATTNAPPPPEEMRSANPAAMNTDVADVGAIAPVEISIPKLAYAYALGFRLPGDRIAAAQEELDQTKAWLTELRGRVAMSDFEISYQAAARQVTPATSGSKLGDATRDSGAAFLIGIQSLLTLLIYLAPWLLVFVPLGFFIWRRARRAGETPFEAPPIVTRLRHVRPNLDILTNIPLRGGI